eukprot:CAMPEP_0184647540 /NCGR_PEP_ID=MMETSP0308-20130426/4499_1 /TAXON_ID=38269 /ORGANISM="Gloeochaete witrockiana, Strain SAG 46.84" /LENGTH=1025 /DNA_ID=CAMNT_0027078603 /DNA_START=59 /DNA_END=3136 /DNA_ORIENTATION=+
MSLQKHGLNCIEKIEKRSFWKFFFKELREPMILLLLAVGLFYAFVQGGESIFDSIIIFVVIIVTVFTEVVNEFKAKNAVKTLKQLCPPVATVRRFGKEAIVDVTSLVPGDVLVLSAGSWVGADARLVESRNLQVDESSLTGESAPAPKTADTLCTSSTPLSARCNMVFARTVVTSGRGVAVVVATGLSTEAGKIVGLVRHAKEPKTSLQKGVKELAKYLTVVAVLVAIGVAALNAWHDPAHWKNAVLTGLVLGFATIPEELPMIITSVLSLGAHRLSKHRVLVKRMRTAEALGGITTLVSDKTGTITENRLVLDSVLSGDGDLLPVRSLLSPVPQSSLQHLLEAWAFSSVLNLDVAGDVVVACHGSGPDDEGPLPHSTDPFDRAVIRAFLSNAEYRRLSTTSSSSSLLPLPPLNLPPSSAPAAAPPPKMPPVASSSSSSIATGPSSPKSGRATAPSSPKSSSSQGRVLLDIFARQRRSVVLDEIPTAAARRVTSFKWKLPRPNESSAEASEVITFLRGAPEQILDLCSRSCSSSSLERSMDTALRQRLFGAVERVASQGMRVIAFAMAHHTSPPAPQQPLQHQNSHSHPHSQAESSASSSPKHQPSTNTNPLNISFVGALAFADPIRPGVADALRQCSHAGIRVIICTGDHPTTATAVARQVGLLSSAGAGAGYSFAAGAVLASSVFTEQSVSDDGLLFNSLATAKVYARATPQLKLKVVSMLQARGDRVAVTGDGVNDSAALSKADVGVAVGSGTDLAKEAAGMILTTNSFLLLVEAIREGRRLHDNLRKALQFYLACKVALVLLFLIPSVKGMEPPLLPLQVILIEVIMDMCALTTFVMEPPEADIMARPPRNPSKAFFDLSFLSYILSGGWCLFMAVGVPYFVALQSPDLVGGASPQTLCFISWLIGLVCLALNFRSEVTPLLVLGPLSNPAMALWSAMVVLATLLVLTVPYVQTVVKVGEVGWGTVGQVLGLSAMTTFWYEVVRWVRYGRVWWLQRRWRNAKSQLTTLDVDEKTPLIQDAV